MFDAPFPAVTMRYSSTLTLVGSPPGGVLLKADVRHLAAVPPPPSPSLRI